MRQKERSERNLRVVLTRMRRVPVNEVAAMFQITPRQVRRIMSDWRDGSLRDDTERAFETVEQLLQSVKDDLKTLELLSAQATLKDRTAIVGARMQLLKEMASILRDSGVSFEGVFDNVGKDVNLVWDANAAVKAAHEKHEVDPEVTKVTMHYLMDTLEKWGYGPGSGEDTSPEDWMGGHGF